MDKQLLADKSYIVVRNFIRVLQCIPSVPGAAGELKIPLDALYENIQKAGWISSTLTPEQSADLRKFMDQTFKEIKNELPPMDSALIERAQPEIDKLISKNPDKLSALSFEDELKGILNKPVYMDEAFLTDGQLTQLTKSFLESLFEKIDGSSLSDKLNREKIEALRGWINNEINEVKRRVTILERESIKNEQEKAQKSKHIKTDNEIYANNFEETLFLHKNAKHKIRLCDIFVPHGYERLETHDADKIYNQLYDEQLNVDDDILEYIRFFINKSSDDLIPSRNYPAHSLLFIEGNAGIGKSSLVSYLAHVYEKNKTKREYYFANHKLVCIRLRDIVPETMKFSKNSIAMDILKYLNISDSAQLKKKYKNTVFILDGYDELCMVEDIGSYADTYIYDICKLFDKNKVIITTRPHYIDINKLDIVNYCVQLKHFDESKRNKWVALYKKQKPNVNEKYALKYIESITDENDTSGVCDTSMALYMITAGRISGEALKNPWVLYHQIFNKELTETEYNAVFPSIDGDQRHPINVYKNRLYRVGAEIAYEMYKTGNKKLFLSKEEIMSVINGMGIENAKEKEIIDRCYALCSYWKSNENKAAVEFYHNNIRDFFMCEKIFYEMEKMYAECRNEEDENKRHLLIIESFGKLFTPEINHKVIEFLYYKTAFYKKHNREGFPLEEQRTKYISKIIMGVLAQYEDANSKRKWARSYESMISCLSNIIQVYRHIYEPYLGESDKIYWLSRKEDADNPATFLHARFLINHFKQLFIKEPIMIDYKPIYTAGKGCFNNLDLSNADLRNAGFAGAVLHYCDFTNAILDGSTFENADCVGYAVNIESWEGLMKTKFTNASLRNVNFFNCSLNYCDFSYTTWENATLPDNFIVRNEESAYKHLKNLGFSHIRWVDMQEIISMEEIIWRNIEKDLEKHNFD